MLVRPLFGFQKIVLRKLPRILFTYAMAIRPSIAVERFHSLMVLILELIVGLFLLVRLVTPFVIKVIVKPTIPYMLNNMNAIKTISIRTRD